MRKTITFDPKGRKDEYEAKALSLGMKVGEWVRLCCDRGLDGFQENLSRGIPKTLSEMAKEAREDEKRGETTPFPPRTAPKGAHGANCPCTVCRGK